MKTVVGAKLLIFRHENYDILSRRQMSGRKQLISHDKQNITPVGYGFCHDLLLF
jgi:hypothetical protein